MKVIINIWGSYELPDEPERRINMYGIENPLDCVAVDQENNTPEEILALAEEGTVRCVLTVLTHKEPDLSV